MEKLKVYQIAAAALLVLNTALLAFIILAPKGEGAGKQFRIIDQLEMTREQHEQFLASADAHRTNMESVNKRQRELLRDYFRTLPNAQADEPAALPAEVLRLEEEKITSTYQHLLEVKGFLTPGQMDNYPAFVDGAMQRILGRQQKRPLRPKDKLE